MGSLGCASGGGRLGRATWCVDGGVDRSAFFGVIRAECGAGCAEVGGRWGGGEQRPF